MGDLARARMWLYLCARDVLGVAEHSPVGTNVGQVRISTLA